MMRPTTYTGAPGVRGRLRVGDARGTELPPGVLRPGEPGTEGTIELQRQGIPLRRRRRPMFPFQPMQQTPQALLAALQQLAPGKFTP